MIVCCLVFDASAGSPTEFALPKRRERSKPADLHHLDELDQHVVVCLASGHKVWGLARRRAHEPADLNHLHHLAHAVVCPGSSPNL